MINKKPLSDILSGFYRAVDAAIYFNLSFS
jgi:hypothetical protein